MLFSQKMVCLCGIAIGTTLFLHLKFFAFSKNDFLALIFRILLKAGKK